jgi:hypothetical protein
MQCIELACPRSELCSSSAERADRRLFSLLLSRAKVISFVFLGWGLDDIACTVVC